MGGACDGDLDRCQAPQLHQLGSRRLGDIRRGAAPLWVVPRGIDDDALAEAEERSGAVEQLPIGRRGGVRRVDPCTDSGDGVASGGLARQLLAHLVGAEHHGADRVGHPRCDGRLPRRGKAPDEDQPDASGVQVPSCDLQEPSGFHPGLGVALRVPDAGDLGSNVRAVRHVVVRQRRRPGVGRQLSVRVEEQLTEVRAAEALEIHGEERDVREDVAVSQVVVELDAVEHPRPILEAEDVVGEQVAVPVPRPPAAMRRSNSGALPAR